MSFAEGIASGSVLPPGERIPLAPGSRGVDMGVVAESPFERGDDDGDVR
jgi:hypothetical protein